MLAMYALCPAFVMSDCPAWFGWATACTQINFTKASVHNRFAIAGRITFIFMNYGRRRVQDDFSFLHCFRFASAHWAFSASTRLFGHLSTKYPHTIDKEFLMHAPVIYILNYMCSAA